MQLHWKQGCLIYGGHPVNKRLRVSSSQWRTEICLTQPKRNTVSASSIATQTENKINQRLLVRQQVSSEVKIAFVRE